MTRLLSLSLCCLAVLCTVSFAADAPAGGAKKKIAVIPKGTTHVFWKSVEAGARKAADELNVEMIWKGPLK